MGTLISSNALTDSARRLHVVSLRPSPLLGLSLATLWLQSRPKSARLTGIAAAVGTRSTSSGTPVWHLHGQLRSSSKSGLSTTSLGVSQWDWGWTGLDWGPESLSVNQDWTGLGTGV